MQRSRFIILEVAMGVHASSKGRVMSRRQVDALSCPSPYLFLPLLLPFFCFIFVPTSLFAQQDLKLAYEKAQQLFEQGETAQSAAAFRALLVQTYQDRAALYQRGGHWKESCDDLRAALDLNPDVNSVRFDLAYANFHLHRYGEAASNLEQLVRASPNDFRIHALLGKTYFSMGKNAASRRELQLALYLNPNDHLTAYTLALADLTDKDKVSADRIFSHLANSMGSSQKFHLVLARAYSDTGFQQSARRELTQALAIDPRIRYGHYLLAVALLREKGIEGLEQAKNELIQESRLFPEEFEAQYMLGVLLSLQRQWDDARRALQKAVLIAPDQPETYFYLGTVYFEQGKPRQAAEELQKSLALSKPRGTTLFPLYHAHMLLSRVYQKLGERTASDQQLREAKGLLQESGKDSPGMPGDSSLREFLAGLASLSPTVIWEDSSPPAPLSARQKQLLGVYGQVLVSGHNYLAQIAVHDGKFADAAEQFARIRNLQPDAPEVNFRLGLALFKAGQFPQAAKPLEEAVAKSPSDADASKYLGLTYFELGQYANAIKRLERAQALSQNDPEVLLALGSALARTHHEKEAQMVFSELMQSHPNSAAVHILLGRAYASQGHTPQAEQEFRRALELDPKMPEAHLNLGLLEMQNGQMAEAGKDFQSELLAHPANIEARYNLAFVLLKQQKTNEAIPLLRQVIKEKPGYAEAHYSLGKVLLEKGDTQEAIAELKKAVELDPKKAYSHYQLGRAYMMAGQRKEAQQEFALTRNLKDQELKFQIPPLTKNP